MTGTQSTLIAPCRCGCVENKNRHKYVFADPNNKKLIDNIPDKVLMTFMEGNGPGNEMNPNFFLQFVDCFYWGFPCEVDLDEWMNMTKKEMNDRIFDTFIGINEEEDE